jgi:hypothetical protein
MEITQKMVLATEQGKIRGDIHALMHLSEVTRGVMADMTSYFEKPKIQMGSFWAEGELQ